MLLSPDSEKAALRIEMFVLCEAVQEFDGRLNLIGTFERIQVPALPAVISGMAVAIRVRFWAEEAGGHRWTLRLINADGAEVMNCIESGFIVPSMTENASDTTSVIVRFQNVIFEHCGEYSLDLYLDESLETSLPLKLAVANEGV